MLNFYMIQTNFKTETLILSTIILSKDTKINVHFHCLFECFKSHNLIFCSYIVGYGKCELKTFLMKQIHQIFLMNILLKLFLMVLFYNN